METETLRPESQNPALRSEPAVPEIPEQPAGQLKPHSTVNHLQFDQQPKPTSPISEDKVEATVQVRSPGSDDPTTEVEDVLESLQAPKPASASTDPAPALQKPHLESRKFPASPACGPTGKPNAADKSQATVKPLAAIEKPPRSDGKRALTRSNTCYPPLPFLPCNADGDVSEDDDDFYRFYHAMFRRKNDSEIAASLPQGPKVVEQLPKPRNTRHATGRVQKRRAAENVNGIPFSDAKYQRMMGSVELRLSDIAQDLATILGVEVWESRVSTSKDSALPSVGKRRRGREAPSTEAPHNKRSRQTGGSSAERTDRSTAAEAGRSTRYGKRGDWHMGSGSGDGGNQGSSKRQRTGGANGSSGDNDQKKMFEKHPDRKGWVVCKKCSAPVWPPNCGKHLFHCRKL